MAIAIGIRPVARAASLVLPFAIVALMMGPWAIIPNNIDSRYISPDAGLGGILIGAGVVGIIVGVWGVSASDPAVARRWLLPFVFVTFVLAMVGDALAYLIFAARNFSL